MDRSLKNLEKMPGIYPIYRDMPSFRFIVVEEYLVFYKVKQNGTVEVHRLIHGRMDLTTQIRE
jgi:plasmid stabilization system protein ParE